MGGSLIPGASACVAKLHIIKNEIEERVKKAVDEICNEIFMVSTENFCPVDTGVLKASARHVIKKSTDWYLHIISYATSYAWFVHELVRFHRHGDRKYLEVPVLMYQRKLIEAIRLAYMGAL